METIDIFCKIIRCRKSQMARFYREHQWRSAATLRTRRSEQKVLISSVDNAQVCGVEKMRRDNDLTHLFCTYLFDTDCFPSYFLKLNTHKHIALESKQTTFLIGESIENRFWFSVRFKPKERNEEFRRSILGAFHLITMGSNEAKTQQRTEQEIVINDWFRRSNFLSRRTEENGKIFFLDLIYPLRGIQSLAPVSSFSSSKFHLVFRNDFFIFIFFFCKHCLNQFCRRTFVGVESWSHLQNLGNVSKIRFIFLSTNEWKYTKQLVIERNLTETKTNKSDLLLFPRFKGFFVIFTFSFWI